jgi:hypothetical protein
VGRYTAEETKQVSVGGLNYLIDVLKQALKAGAEHKLNAVNPQLESA